MMTGPWAGADQAKHRRQQTVVDQFGRKWTFSVENKTGHAIGQIMPLGWSDPLATPQKYVDTTSDLGKCTVLFERWIKDLELGMKEWKERLYEIGNFRYKIATPDEVAKWETDPYLLRDAGPQPGAHLHALCKRDEMHKPVETPVDVLKRAMAGDIELLLDKASIERGDVIVAGPADVTWPQFLAEARKQGKTPEQASAAWKLVNAEKQLAGV